MTARPQRRGGEETGRPFGIFGSMNETQTIARFRVGRAA